MFRPWALAVLSSAAFLAGCDPGAYLGGTVLDARSAKPLADAIVILGCSSHGKPDGDFVYSALTDARGAFSIAQLGYFPPTCSVEIHREGYATEVTTLGDLCRSAAPKAVCATNLMSSESRVRVELVPLAGGAP
jgi:hypothetical protein